MKSKPVSAQLHLYIITEFNLVQLLGMTENVIPYRAGQYIRKKD